MDYNTSTRVSTHSSTADRAIAGVIVAGVMFVLGYTVVRANLAQTATGSDVATDEATIQMAVPGEGTLWADFGTRF
ncbi:MAG: hypothetical protein WBD47_17425 [Phormidesmis sp.]